MLNGVPFESDFKALRHPIIDKGPNPSIVNGVVWACKWFETILTVDDPMPTTGAPV